MNALVRAELAKLCTRAHAAGLLVCMIFVPIAVASEIPKPGKGGTALSLDDPRLLALAVGTGFFVPLFFMALLGGVAFTQEFRYGTVTPTYLVEPRRRRVLAAKCVALALVSALISTLTLAVAVPFAVATIRSRGGEVTVGARFWQTVAVAFVVIAVYAVVGVAIGSLVRNQVTFVVAALVWMLAVEQMVIPAYMSVGRWMPMALVFVLLQQGPSVDPGGHLLSIAASGVLLVVYSVAVSAVAVRLISKRDVL
jgi:ABC-2 type transport system permease protein